MIAIRRPHPLVFLGLFAISGAAISWLIGAYDLPGLGAFIYFAWVLVASQWYQRPVYVAAIAILDVLVLPTFLELLASHPGVGPVFLIGNLTLYGVAEATHRLFENQRKLLEREHRIAAELREREQDLSELLQNNPAILFRAVPDRAAPVGWNFQFHSANALKVLGYAAEEIDGTPGFWLEHLHPEDRKPVIAQTRALLNARPDQTTPSVWDYRFRHQGGHYLWLQESLQVLFDEAGRPVELHGQCLDITHQKTIELALLESRRDLDAVVGNSPAALFRAVADPKIAAGLRYVFCTENILDLTGLSAADLISGAESWGRYVHPDDLAEVSARVRTYLLAVGQASKPLTLANRFKRPDGREIWIQFTLRAIWGDDGKVLEFVGQCLDVTAQKQLEIALAEANERVRQVLTHSPILSYSCVPIQRATDPWEYTYISEGSRQILGLEPAEVIAISPCWLEFIHPDDRERVAQTLLALAEQSVYSFEFRFRRAGGRYVWLHDFGRVVRAADGRAIALVGHLEDVTVQREATEVLRQAEARLRHIFSNSPMATYTLNLRATPTRDLYCSFITDNIQTLTGYTAQELIADEPLWGSRIHPADRSMLWDARSSEPLARAPVIEFRFRRRDGVEIWLEDTSHAMLDAQGEVIEIIGQLQDVSERRRVQLEADAGQRFVTQLTASIPSQVLVVDIATERVVYSNRARPNLLDHAAAVAEGVTLTQILRRQVHPDDSETLEKALAGIPSLADNEAITVNLRLSDTVGRWRDLLVRYRVFLRNAEDQPAQILIVWDDISEARQAERDLASSQHLLARVAQAVPGVLYLLDLHRQHVDGGIIYANRALPVLLGYSTDGVRELGWQRFLIENLHPEDRARFPEEMRRTLALRDGEVLENEYRLRDAAGAWRWMRGRSLVFERDAQGAVSQVIGLIEDITTSKALQTEVRAERDFAQLVLTTLGQGVAVFDAEGRCEYINPAGALILGIEAERLIGADLLSILPLERQAAVMALLLEHEGDYSTGVFEFRHQRPEGRFVDLLVTTSQRRRDGVGTGTVVVFTDLTDRKAMERILAATNLELEQALATARDLTREAQAANRAKSAFLANMSHEIRTPMNAIVGVAELIQDSGLTEEQGRLTQVMVEAGQALLEIINDILDFSKIEAGRYELDPHEFVIAEVVEGVVDLLAVRAAQKDLRLTCYVDPSIPATLIGDPGRLRQILVNLLSNAIKFTPKGRVSIRAKLDSVNDGRATLQFSVRDTGIGIAPEAQGRIFEPFVQADGGTTRRFGGSGLGLAIVKRLIDLMQGTISLVSQPGEGTEVDVRLTFDAQGAEPVPAAPPGSRGRAILIEPDAPSGDIAERYLTHAGFACTLQTEPGLALPWLLRQPEPALLMLGIWQAEPTTGRMLRDVQADSRLNRWPKIIVADASLDRGDGSAVLTRPIKRAQLLELASAGGLPVKEAAVTTLAVTVLSAPSTTPKATMLLAEDNPVNQRVATLQLDKLGFVVEAVQDGGAAVATYQAAPERYCAILMDCQMPVLDGFGATARIRAWETERGLGQHIPIIAMTANAMAGDREICVAAGMDDYISKPVGRQALRQVLISNRLLREDQAAEAGPPIERVP